MAEISSYRTNHCGRKHLNFLKMNVIVNVKPADAGLLGGIRLTPEQLLLQFG
jgi:hypothetical protein